MYQVGYLTQAGPDGQTWATGLGPVAENLRITSTHERYVEAVVAARLLVGTDSPMGTVADAYVLDGDRVLGEVREGRYVRR
jgi:hypothetical protein